MVKLNSNDKVSIRVIVMNMQEYRANDTGVLRRINTGSNIYTVIYRYNIADGLRYSVQKHSKTGKYIGETHITNLTYHGFDYNNYNGDMSLPSSVSVYIREFNNALEAFIKYGNDILN